MSLGGRPSQRGIRVRHGVMFDGGWWVLREFNGERQVIGREGSLRSAPVSTPFASERDAEVVASDLAAAWKRAVAEHGGTIKQRQVSGLYEAGRS